MRRLLAVALAAMIFAGCSSHRRAGAPEFRSPLEATGQQLLRDATIDELQRILDRRAATYATLVAQGRVTLAIEGDSRRRWFEANLLWRRDPAAVRLRGSRVGPGTLFEMLTTRDEAWFYLNGDRTLYLGTPDQFAHSAGVLGALSLDDMMAALLVSQDLRGALAAERWRLRLSTAPDTLTITRPSPGGGDKTWIVRRADAFVREMRLRDAAGTPVARVRYDAYEFAQPGAPMPSDLTITLPGEGLEARFEVSSWKLDPELKSLVFERPRGVRDTLPLAELGNAAPVELDEERTP